MGKFGQASLPYMNLVWFGIDKHERVAAFYTLGDGNVPEFVTDSDEETEALFDHFFANDEKAIKERFQFSYRPSEEELIGQGIFVYGLDTKCSGGEELGGYKRKAAPRKALLLSELPDEIRQMLESHRIDFDAETDEYVLPDDTNRL